MSGGEAEDALPDGLPARTFWINLDSRPDRRATMEASLSRHGVRGATRVAAAGPSDARVLEWQAEWPQWKARAGAAGCAVSHFEVWEAMLRDEACEAALVLEDDVRFLRGWRRQLGAALRTLPAGWEMLMLDCRALDESWTFSGPPWPTDAAAEDEAVALLPASACVFTDAYVLTREAARWCVAQRAEVPWRDAEGILVSMQERGRSFTTMPRLALQRWDDSNIQPAARVASLHDFYRETYFRKYPEALYDE